MEPERTKIYQVIVNGAIDPGWSDWLGDLELEVRTDPDGSCQTILTGNIHDQAALRGILAKIWDLNLELVSCKQIKKSHQ